MQEQIIDFYEKVVSCQKTPTDCPRTKNSIESDYPPRGFMSGGNPGDIDIMIVGKNPGHIMKDEEGAYSNKSPREIVEEIFRNPTWEIPDKVSRDTTFHKNLIEYLTTFLNIRESEIFKRCVYTNLVKCSTETEKEKLKAKTKDQCFNSYLHDEIILWKPKVLLALGREVEYFLNKKSIKEKHGKPIIYIKHPSYYYKTEQKDQILEEIKTEINKYLK